MYHELAYLHPNHFTPDPKIVEAYGIDTSKPYFVMRFASLNAHHDSGIKGINTEIAQRLIDILEGSGFDHFESDPSQLVPFSSNSSPNNSTKGTSLTPSEACSLSTSSGNKLVPLSTNSPSTNSTSGNKPRIYITSERPLEPQFVDEDDRVFYEVALTEEDSFLVTGNLKHYPVDPRVVTPAQMVAILEG